MVRVLTPQGLRELTDAEDCGQNDDDAQQSREEDWPPASPRVGLGTPGWGIGGVPLGGTHCSACGGVFVPG